MARKASPSLLDDVRSRLPTRLRPQWISTVPAETRHELEAIRADFAAGRLGPSVSRTGLSRAIAAALVARGVPTHPHTVSRWLEH
jgi:hypothetical protein